MVEGPLPTSSRDHGRSASNTKRQNGTCSNSFKLSPSPRGPCHDKFGNKEIPAACVGVSLCEARSARPWCSYVSWQGTCVCTRSFSHAQMRALADNCAYTRDTRADGRGSGGFLLRRSCATHCAKNPRLGELHCACTPLRARCLKTEMEQEESERQCQDKRKIK